MNKLTWIGQKKDVNTKNGLKQQFSIKVEGNDNYLSGFCNAVTDSWKVGDNVEIVISSREYNGKTYYNFNLPKKGEISNDKLEHILTKLSRLQFSVDKIIEHLTPKSRLTSVGTPIPFDAESEAEFAKKSPEEQEEAKKKLYDTDNDIIIDDIPF